MDLDAVLTKWLNYSRGIAFRDEAECRLATEAFKAAWMDGYITGHQLGKVEGIANTVIDKAMKYE